MASSSAQSGQNGLQPLPALTRENTKYDKNRVTLDDTAFQIQTNLPRIPLACSMEAPFCIAQYIRAGAVVCDFDFQGQRDVSAVVRNAVLARTEMGIRIGYDVLAKTWMGINQGSSLPQVTKAHEFLTADMPQLLFTTGYVEWCDNCEGSAKGTQLPLQDVKRRSLVSLYDDADLAGAAIAAAGSASTLADPKRICNLFFHEYQSPNCCGLCGDPLRRQIRVRDRLPRYLTVEDPDPARTNNIFQFCSGCEFTYTLESGQERRARYPQSVASALSVPGEIQHFVALLHANGVSNGGVEKDVQRPGKTQWRNLTPGGVGSLNARVAFTVLKTTFDA